MLSRYAFGDFRMSRGDFLPDEASGRGKSGVTGLATCSSSPGIPARRPMYSRTGSLAMTLPISTPRFVIPCMLCVEILRSSTAECGASTSARVLAAETERTRGLTLGGKRLTLPTLQSAAQRARMRLAMSPIRCPQSSRRVPAELHY